MAQGRVRVGDDAGSRVRLALGRAFHRRGTRRGCCAVQLTMLCEGGFHFDSGGLRGDGARDLVLARVLCDGGDLRAMLARCRHDSRYLAFEARMEGHTSALAPQAAVGPAVQRIAYIVDDGQALMTEAAYPYFSYPPSAESTKMFTDLGPESCLASSAPTLAAKSRGVNTLPRPRLKACPATRSRAIVM